MLGQDRLLLTIVRCHHTPKGPEEVGSLVSSLVNNVNLRKRSAYNLKLSLFLKSNEILFIVQKLLHKLVLGYQI
jgi:hypothetical protein